MFCPRERSRDVNGKGLDCVDSRKQLKKVQVFPESDAVSSARVAVPDRGHGVRYHVRPVKVPSQTVIHLVLAVMTGEDDVMHRC